MEKAIQKGTITYVNHRGVAYLQDVAGQSFGFTFDKIADYHGQEAAELGLQTGRPVLFDQEDGLISRVRFVQ